ncbi:MAG: formylglycine-generating enzyme family protein [Lentisphaeria bacterium]|nr:formylglycine-generating enzyme family protein [Lentisphaeria bacterium]
MKTDDYKQAVADWIKTHPTHTKVIIVAVLVVLFCIIFVSCKGKNEPPKPPVKPPVQKTVVPPAPVPDAPVQIPDAPGDNTVTDVDTSAPELSAEHTVTLPNNVELKLVRISKGRFKTGRQWTINIANDFYIGIFEVTQSQYQAVTGQNPSRFKAANLPVERVTWDNAVMFCEKLNAGGYAPAGWKFALPSSGQWEYACRAGTKTPFFWGKTLDGSRANCNGTKPYGTSRKGAYLKKTSPVGSYDPNPWGIYDMHGNVWEWCADSSSANRKGKKILAREIRGGSWGTGAIQCQAASRLSTNPASVNMTIGFRVVLVKE